MTEALGEGVVLFFPFLLSEFFYKFVRRVVIVTGSATYFFAPPLLGGAIFLRRVETALSIIDWIDGPGLVASAISTSAASCNCFFAVALEATTKSQASTMETTL